MSISRTYRPLPPVFPFLEFRYTGAMPAQMLHFLFGEDLIAELYRRMTGRDGGETLALIRRSIRGADRGIFCLGCQGPDIFYHAQLSRPVGLEYGSLLHRRGYGTFTGELFKAVFDPAKAAPGPYQAYALGFMTHAFLDRAAHPYIVYKAGWYSRPDPGTAQYAQTHAFFERILDALMLEYLRGEDAAFWDQEALLAEACANPPPDLKTLLRETLIRAFPERAGADSRLERRIDNTLADCAVFYTLTAPQVISTRRRYGGEEHRRLIQQIPPAYLHPERLPLDTDYLNLARARWQYPVKGGRADWRTFPELYGAAIADAADALAAPLARCLRGASPPDIAAAVSNRSLSIQDDEGRPCAPEISAPLPLPAALEQQRRLREQ